MNESDKHSTEWALLFPLRAGLFSVRHSGVTRSHDRIKKKRPSKETPKDDRLGMRRGSSMSELDKLSSSGLLPDLVRSTTAHHQLSASPASVPHSPYLSRSGISTASHSVRDSIGDLMNQKKYGSSQWSVRSESLIARLVPLSTVTPRQSPPEMGPKSDVSIHSFISEESDNSGPLTTAQRAQRLSRLIKQQRSTKHTGITVCLCFIIHYLDACR
ncbi:hypothetical protein RI129_000219 [Pyrocoelia pectoralis]|uniref:Uncharacterized protein n=1 Tax=Pyrocoelia pectoralis TaxID=417401 RepID=A0AAN7ZJ56_9COLE